MRKRAPRITGVQAGTAAADKKIRGQRFHMEIESELPGDFEDLDEDDKIEELEQLKKSIDSSTDAGAVKERIVEELIREYRGG